MSRRSWISIFTCSIAVVGRLASSPSVSSAYPTAPAGARTGRVGSTVKAGNKPYLRASARPHPVVLRRTFGGDLGLGDARQRLALRKV